MRVNELASKILGGSKQASELTGIIDCAREFKCIGDITGREYEIELFGHVVGTIRQKPMKISQVTTLMKELNLLRKLENAELKKNMPKRRTR